ncbi:MAG: hypothetical protein R3362_11595, partial [Rhodothermales bacterium]|nr:hypothetical protein [Rhodothermales bacterium]
MRHLLPLLTLALLGSGAFLMGCEPQDATGPDADPDVAAATDTSRDMQDLVDQYTTVRLTTDADLTA